MEFIYAIPYCIYHAQFIGGVLNIPLLVQYNLLHSRYKVLFHYVASILAIALGHGVQWHAQDISTVLGPP